MYRGNGQIRAVCDDDSITVYQAYSPAIAAAAVKHGRFTGSFKRERIQWDPECDLRLRPLPHRSIQIGLSGEAVGHYCDDWIAEITDVTDLARVRIVEGDRVSAVEPGQCPPPARLHPPK